MLYFIGQLFGIIATVLSIVAPFFKKKWQILANIIAVNLLMALNFVCIGQIGSAIFLYLVAIVQSIVSMIHTSKGTEIPPAEKILFFILYVGCGFLGMVTAPDFVWEINGHNLLELLPILGAVMLMISVFTRGEQTTRKFLLANAIIWSVYTAIVGSTTFFAEITAVCSTSAALYKYRKKTQ